MGNITKVDTHMDRDDRINAIADSVFQTVPVMYRWILRPDATGLSPYTPKMSVLVAVKKNGPISMSAIAQQLSYSKQNLTKIVEQLVQEGFVERVTGQNDRRVLNISMTDKGLEFMAHRRAIFKNRLAEELSHLGHEELDYLFETFERVKAALPKMLPTGQG
jgi:DNA-binding MarR family transcriptional regulator